MAQSDTLDYECELVIVIGREAKDVSEEDALNYVLGYAVGDDVSHRNWQIKLGGGQWSLGKGFDGWAPIGPGIVSPKLIKDPNSLDIWTKVNGRLLQKSNTADMIFNARQAISFLSKGSTLLPGDIIFTGTDWKADRDNVSPQGVGMGQKPPLWLKHSDEVEVGIEDIGTCTNRVVYVKAQGAKL
ncbi:hypothetical protein KEM54_005845 [Ascosphaera aggregata]|nr:hypothetical protein KEM54_005845 [Ascosphaera aggregata]